MDQERGVYGIMGSPSQGCPPSCHAAVAVAAVETRKQEAMTRDLRKDASDGNHALSSEFSQPEGFWMLGTWSQMRTFALLVLEADAQHIRGGTPRRHGNPDATGARIATRRATAMPLRLASWRRLSGYFKSDTVPELQGSFGPVGFRIIQEGNPP
jgi:hypothetical protein